MGYIGTAFSHADDQDFPAPDLLGAMVAAGMNDLALKQTEFRRQFWFVVCAGRHNQLVENFGACALPVPAGLRVSRTSHLPNSRLKFAFSTTVSSCR